MTTGQMKARELRPRVGDLRQSASVRRIALDDGAERGVRALAFSTGGGLDFWVLADRSLDIGPLWWKGMPVAWQSPAGFRNPSLHDAEGDGGQGFGRSFSGFLVTGGLDHIRQPANGQPLHGRLPYTPARVAAYGEDWQRGVLFCEGEVTQARHGAEALRLTRRIEAPIGGTSLVILDTVENLGPGPWPQASLYHFNLGYPALADGTVVEAGGETLLGPLRVPDPAMTSGEHLPARQRRLRGADAVSGGRHARGAVCLERGDSALSAVLARSGARRLRAERRALHQRQAGGRVERRGSRA